MTLRIDWWSLIAEPAVVSIVLGSAWDAIIGDPRGWQHPVRAIGWLIGKTERLLRRFVIPAGGNALLERFAGIDLALLTIGTTAVVSSFIVFMGDRSGWLGSLVVRTLMIGIGLAGRSLAVETLRAAEAPDLAAARRELGMIVGRDTHELDWPEVHRACVETVGENANDGVIAPLFWVAVAGPVGLWIYKAISTLDSMVGYRDRRYQYLGWASARLDDLAASAPARLTWLLISCASLFCREHAFTALRVGWRDGREHSSPNAGWGEASMAGSLGVQLGGPARYRGELVIKPLLGDPGDSIDASVVRRSIRIMQTAAWLMVVLAWLGRWAILDSLFGRR